MIILADTKDFRSKNYDNDEDFKIILSDEEITNLGFSEEELREKYLEFNETYPNANAVWHGQVTNQFKKWLKGNKIYDREKERISFYLSEGIKNKWHQFIEDKEEITSYSKLIREAVNFYINNYQEISNWKDNHNEFLESNIALKESLTVIKGTLDLLLKEYSKDLNDRILYMVKDAYEKSTLIESDLRKIGEHDRFEDIDLYCIEDDPSTMRLLKIYTEERGYTFKGAENGRRAIEVLKTINPKLIFLDIWLPYIDGFEICKYIKSNNDFKDIIVYYITCQPRYIVESKLKETGADGYILKPFSYDDIVQILDKFLKK